MSGGLLRRAWSDYRPIISIVAIIVLADVGIGLAAPLWAGRVRELGGTATFLGFVVGAVGVARLFAATGSGLLSDRLGRVRMFIAALALLAVAALGTALTPAAWSLLLLRFLEGAGWETMNVAGVAFVADMLREDPYRGRVMSAYQGARRGSQALSPALGGVLATLVGTANSFVVYALLAAAGFVLALRVLPSGGRGGGVRRTELSDLGGMLSTPRFLALGIVGFLLTGADLAFQQQIIPTVGHDMGLSQAQVGFALGAYGLLLISTVVIGGWIVDRYGPRVSIAVGFLVVAAGYSLVPLAGGFALLTIAMAVAGLGRGLAGAGPNVFVLDLFPDHQGAAQGAYRSINGAGRALLPPVMSGLVAVSLGLGVWVVSAALALTTLGLVRLSAREEAKQRTDSG